MTLGVFTSLLALLVGLISCSSGRESGSTLKSSKKDPMPRLEDSSQAMFKAIELTYRLNETCRQTNPNENAGPLKPECDELSVAWQHANDTFAGLCKARFAQQYPNTLKDEESFRLVAEVCEPLYVQAMGMAAQQFDATTHGEKSYGLITMIADALLTLNGQMAFELEPGHFDAFFSTERLQTILDSLVYSAADVSYDGETSKLVFQSKELEKQINYLAMAFQYSAPRLRQLFGGLSSERLDYWSQDTNTTDQASRVEPIDLLTVQIKNFVKPILKRRGYEANPIVLGQLAGAAVLKVMGRYHEESKSDFHVVRAEGGAWDRSGLVVCADPSRIEYSKDSTLLKEANFQGYYNPSPGYRALQVKKLDNRLIERLGENGLVRCGNTSFAVHTRSVGGDHPIAIPEIKVGPLTKVVFSTALINEMDETGLYGAIAYLVSKGYVIQPNVSAGGKLWTEINDLTAVITEDLNNANIFIPASHNGNGDHVKLGSKDALLIKAWKQLLDRHGRKKMVLLHFYLPPIRPDGSAPVDAERFHTEDIQRIFSYRAQTRKPPLIVFSMSCFSDVTLDIWMRQFKLFADAHENDLGHAPIVFGSKKGFATNSSFQILSHFEYPLNAAEHMAAGASVDEVIAMLADPLPWSIQREVLSYLQRFTTLRRTPTMDWGRFFDLGYWKESETDFLKSFDPVVNTLVPHYWDGTARMDLAFSNILNAEDVRVY